MGAGKAGKIAGHVALLEFGKIAFPELEVES